MRHRHAVAGHDDDLAGVTHHRSRIDRPDFLHRAGDRFARTARHHGRKEDVGERAVHRLGHELGEQRTGRADHNAGDDQRRIAQHVALETDGQAGEGVEQRDHDRHVGTADRQRDDQTEHQRHGEETENQLRLGRGEGHHGCAERDGQQGQHDIDGILRGQPIGLLEHALQLGPGNAGTGEGHRADQRADHGQDGGDHTVRVALGELDGGNRGSGAAAHAVVDGDHLRHVGHLDLLAGDPGHGTAEHQGQGHQRQVLKTGNEEGRGNRQQHAVTGNNDPFAGRGRRPHALQTEDEEQRADVPGALNVERQGHDQASFFLNMASMRSVTT